MDRAVLVHALALRCDLADGEVADAEQFRPGPLGNRRVVGRLDVPVVPRGTIEEDLVLLDGLGAVLVLRSFELLFAEETRELPRATSIAIG